MSRPNEARSTLGISQQYELKYVPDVYHELAFIQYGQFKRVNSFMETNRTLGNVVVLNKTIREFKEEAKHAMIQKDKAIAESCLQQAVLLQEFRDLANDNLLLERDPLVKRLSRNDPESQKEFSRLFKDLHGSIAAVILAAPVAPGPPQLPSTPVYNLASAAVSGYSRHSANVPATAAYATSSTLAYAPLSTTAYAPLPTPSGSILFPREQQSVEDDTSGVTMVDAASFAQYPVTAHLQSGSSLNTRGDITIPTARVQQGGRIDEVAAMTTRGLAEIAKNPDEPRLPNSDRALVQVYDGESAEGADQLLVTSTLHPSYKLWTRKEAFNFFVVGRVFSILWHENEGLSIPGPDQTQTTISRTISHQLGSRVRGKFGEFIYSDIRRMVIVMARDGFCWCCPIATYGGHGLLKKKVREFERRAHTALYVEGLTEPTIYEEEGMTKQPLAIETKDNIHAMSRLNFAAVHTVQWNWRVKNVGMIAKGSMRFFKQYWANMATNAADG